MKHTTKGIFAIALACLMIASLGCSLVSVNEEKDLAQVVAKVGDTEITKEEYLGQFNYMYQMYQQFGWDPAASEEDFEAFKQEILDSVIGSEVQVYQALKRGLKEQFTEEETAYIQEQVDSYDLQVYEIAKAQADANITQNPELDFDKEMTEQYRLAAYSMFGKEMSQPEAKTFVEDFYTNNTLRTKLQEEIYAGISVTEEEVRAAYDDQLAADTASLEEDASSYKGLQEYYEKYESGLPPMYAPAGYIRVKEISILPEEELPAEYEEKLAEMESLSNELGKLSLEDKVANAERIAEIEVEYATLKEETDQVKEEHLAAVRAKAEEAYEKLLGGASFDTVMMDYTANQDIQGYEAFQKNGLLMSKDTEVEDWDPKLKEAALALQKGSYTELIELGDGFYILQYVGDEPTGERKYEDYQETFYSNTLSAKQSEEYNALMEEWIADTSVVTRYPEVLDNL